MVESNQSLSGVRISSDLNGEKRTRGIARDFVWLVLSSGAGMALTFMFWVLMARSADASIIGTSASFLSLSVFLSTLGCLGLTSGIVRFIHHFNSKFRAANFFAGIGFLAAVALAVIGSGIVTFLRSQSSLGLTSSTMVLLFAMVTGFGSLSALLDSALLSVGRSPWVMARNATSGAIRIMAVLLSSTDVKDIVLAWLAGSVGSVIIGELLLARKGNRRVEGNTNVPERKGLKKEVLSYSVLFSIGSFFWGLPQGAFPILTSNILGADKAAYFYVAYTMVTILIVAIQTLTLSSFNYASKKEEVPLVLFRRLLLVSWLLTSGALALTVAFGRELLSLFGTNYSEESLVSLLILIGSCYFLSIISVNVTIFALVKRIHWINVVFVSSSVTVLGIGILAMDWLGITGISLAYLCGYAIGGAISLRIVRLLAAPRKDSGHASVGLEGVRIVRGQSIIFLDQSRKD